jgi:AAA domain-containing protein/bifunctional DNA primase/polymerase-like protein/primase-like protein
MSAQNLSEPFPAEFALPNRALAAALALAEEEGIPVFPCRPDKKPHTLHGLKDASTNLEQIEQWWRQWPSALIAIPTGRASKLLVIDIDPEGADWYALHGSELNAGRVHKTRRGHHLLYRIPGTEIRNSAGKIAPGVDVRGEGGYLIWWPAHGLEAIGDLADIVEPPSWLMDLLTAMATNATSTTVNSTPGVIGCGRRNDTLSREAYRLRRLGASVSQIETVLSTINETLCSPPLLSEEVQQIARGKASIAAPEAVSLVLRPIHEIVAERRETMWLLPKILEANVIAVLAGQRGTFKSFIALDWAIRMALAGHHGAVLSGEGAGLDRRVAAWMQHHGRDVELEKLPLVALERPLNLNVTSELDALKAAVAALPKTPAFIVIDTLSKFSAGLDENDNGEVAAFLSALSAGLREAFNCSVLLVAHSGHGDAKRPRGASALMTNPDAEYIVERPGQGMTVTVTRDRFKDTASLPPLAYTARVIDLGRQDAFGQPVTSLALDSADMPVNEAKAKTGMGRNQERGLAALREWVRSNQASTHVASNDLHDLLKTQGLKDRNRRSEVINFLVNIRVLTPAVGGHIVHPEVLQ